MVSGALRVGTATLLGARLMSHHLQQRTFVARDHGVLAVVRGYGGQASGDIAVRTFVEELERALARVGTGARREAVVDALAAAAVRLRAAPPDARPRTASVTAAVVDGGCASFVHVGGNAGYHLDPLGLRRVTADHTLDLGRYLDVGPYHRRVVLHALGGDDERIEQLDLALAPRDRLVIANDTIVRAMTMDEVRERAGAADVHEAARELVALAHERIDDDSATAVVAQVV